MTNIINCEPSELNKADVEEIWNFIRLFVDRNFNEFESTLLSCQFIILLKKSDNNELVGIFAYNILEVIYVKKKVKSIFVQWGMLHPNYRRTILIQLLIIKEFIKLKIKYPFSEIYYTFIASTYKSYVMLHNSIKTYWPNANKDIPQSIKEIQDLLMKKTFGRQLGY